jgi:hypothetical protein
MPKLVKNKVIKKLLKFAKATSDPKHMLIWTKVYVLNLATYRTHLKFYFLNQLVHNNTFFTYNLASMPKGYK